MGQSQRDAAYSGIADGVGVGETLSPGPDGFPAPRLCNPLSSPFGIGEGEAAAASLGVAETCGAGVCGVVGLAGAAVGDPDGGTIVAEGMDLGRDIGLTGVGDAVAFPTGTLAAAAALGAVEADGVAVGACVNLRSGTLVTGRAVADAVGDGVDVGATVDLRTDAPVGLTDGETLALGDGDDVDVGRTVGLRTGVAVGFADGETVALATGTALSAGVAGTAVV